MLRLILDMWELSQHPWHDGRAGPLVSSLGFRSVRSYNDRMKDALQGAFMISPSIKGTLHNAF